MRSVAPFILAILLPIAVLSAPQTGGALSLPNEVGERYASATSYHIEAIQEKTSSNDLSRDWRKSLMTAIVAPGGLYRYVRKTGFDSAMAVSDGKTAWKYHFEENVYTENPAGAATGEAEHFLLQEEFGLN